MSDVSGAAVYVAANEEGQRTGEPRRITDTESLRAGLALLSRCTTEVDLNKESYTNGYVIILESGKWQTGDYKIGVFRSTTRNKSKTGVVPYTSVDRTGYLCPSFQQWVTENVDPLFAEAPSTSAD
ncbi:MAG: hypothetical protein QUS14_10355 [Pyrinomonadaceae bacterium]|nr:hypothetical protein [Pyrinomonadaceae bacterium]